jgi:hypothetical protein
MHDARNSYAQNVPIGYRLLGRYLEKAYNSVPGGVGSKPPHGISNTPPYHTINHAELACIDIGLHLGHTHLLTDSACSLRLIQGIMRCPFAY